MKYRGLTILIVGLLLGTAVYFLWPAHDKKNKAVAPLSVEALAVYSTTLYDRVDALGTTLANESIDITPTLTESIASIDFTEGQEIKKGDVIVRLQQEEEQAQLLAAKARLAENERELKRIEELLKNKAAARRDYDERLTLIEISKREIEEVQARIKDRTLRAPFSGILGIRRLSEGALVQPGQIITTLDDISRIKLEFTVPARYLSFLKPGVAIEAKSDALGDKIVRGKVSQVNSRIDPVTRSVLVRATLPNDDRILKAGMLMEVSLLQGERQGLVVAEESIIPRGKNNFVLVVKEDGTLEQRQITTGIHPPGMVEVVKGLREGEKVIIRGMNVARAGQKVTIGQLWDKIRPPEDEKQEK